METYCRTITYNCLQKEKFFYQLKITMDNTLIASLIIDGSFHGNVGGFFFLRIILSYLQWLLKEKLMGNIIKFMEFP